MLCNNVAREVSFDLLDDGEDGAQKGVRFVELSKIFVIQDAYFLWREQFD